MSLGDRIRAFFTKKSNPALGELEGWAAEHKGVEGFIEPQTSTSPTTLLLVDRYGDHLRGPVREPQDATAFCERIGIPVYDARVVGYPKRMKEFDKRSRTDAADDLERQIAEIERRLDEPGPPEPGAPTA